MLRYGWFCGIGKEGAVLTFLSALQRSLSLRSKQTQSQKNRQTAARRKFVEGEQFFVTCNRTCIRQSGIWSFELVNLIFWLRQKNLQHRYIKVNPFFISLFEKSALRLKSVKLYLWWIFAIECHGSNRWYYVTLLSEF